MPPAEQIPLHDRRRILPVERQLPPYERPYRILWRRIPLFLPVRGAYPYRSNRDSGSSQSFAVIPRLRRPESLARRDTTEFRNLRSIVEIS